MSLDQRLINVLLSQHWWWVANGESRVEGGRDVINIYLDNGQHNGNYLECPAVVL